MRHFSFNNISPFDTPKVITPFLSADERGDFTKDFHRELYESNDINFEIKEVFYTNSKKGVVRALHFQTVKPQAKLVRCVSGKIFDVIVDLRINSATYMKWKSFILTADGSQLYIPEGFAHGYLVLEDSIVSYMCNEKFYSEYDTGVKWDDERLNICWPTELVEKIILSDKDRTLETLSEYEKRVDAFK